METLPLMPKICSIQTLFLALLWATSVADTTTTAETRFKLDLDFSNEWKASPNHFVYKYSKLELEPKLKHRHLQIQGDLQWDLSMWGQQIWDQAWLGLHTPIWSSRLGRQKSPWGLDSKLGQSELWFDNRSSLAQHQRKDLDLAGQIPTWMNRLEFKKKWTYRAEFWLGPSEHFESPHTLDFWSSFPLVLLQTQSESWLTQYLYAAPEMAYNLNLRGDLRRQRISLHEFWVQTQNPLWELRFGTYMGPDLDTLSAKLYWDDRDLIKHGLLFQSRIKLHLWGLNLGYERAQWKSKGVLSQLETSLDYQAFPWVYLRLGTHCYPHLDAPTFNLRVQYQHKYK